MNLLGLSPKEFKIIADRVAPDGWIVISPENGGKSKKLPSESQIAAVRDYLEKSHMMDKKREYLLAMVERLRPEVERNNLARTTD